MTTHAKHNLTTATSQRMPLRCGLAMRGLGTLLLAAMLASAGCTRYHDTAAFLKEPAPVVSSQPYRILPPDVVMIQSKRVREINGHQEEIRPDGYITLPLLGSYFVAGKTCEEASAELQKNAREFYEDADVSLRVVVYNSKKIYVWGEVSAPGPYPYTGGNTIFHTLSRAQPTRIADFGRVDVLRPNRDGEMIRRMTIDLDDMAKKGDMSLNAVLEEGDVIYVHAHPLAAVGLLVQQVLLPIIPVSNTMQGTSDITQYSAGRKGYLTNNTTP